ncbi:hypothetical protein GT043_05425 [Streptomyces sp. SID2131]|nr:hypothetical protein [Streptomyces sp. SID2131]
MTHAVVDKTGYTLLTPDAAELIRRADNRVTPAGQVGDQVEVLRLGPVRATFVMRSTGLDT